MTRVHRKSGEASQRLRTSAPPKVAAELLADLDTQLMLRLRAGDTEAGATLVRRNFERVSRYVGRIVRAPHVIEDLTQDVFVQVFRSAAQYEPTARFTTWLYRIATNAARNYLARAHVRRDRQPDPEDGEENIPDHADSAPERQLSLDELRERVSSALSRLPVNQRIAVTLCEYEGFSYDQIAAVLETSEEAVRGLLKRARASLRKQLRGLL